MDQILFQKKVLVVEDEETNWFLIRDILQQFQTELVWAEVGKKAVDLIRQGKVFDVILMDIHLPSMDGLEVTQEIKKLRPEIPIIAQTAFALDTEIEKCYEAGCVGHVCKPFTFSELTAVMKEVLENQN